MTRVVGYTFKTDTLCRRCIIPALPTGDGEAFDGWALAPGIHMSVEDNLAELAHAFGIDHQDQKSYDSGDFPKVIFNDQVESADERCTACHLPLIP